jgi:hypothetical protein
MNEMQLETMNEAAFVRTPKSQRLNLLFLVFKVTKLILLSDTVLDKLLNLNGLSFFHTVH